MTQPTIITAAITGALPRKAQTPAVPVTPSEQIESTHEAYEAGAALVHIHVRNRDESPSSDPELFAGADRRQKALPRHDHPVFNRRTRAQPKRARARYQPAS